MEPKEIAKNMTKGEWHLAARNNKCISSTSLVEEFVLCDGDEISRQEDTANAAAIVSATIPPRPTPAP